MTPKQDIVEQMPERKPIRIQYANITAGHHILNDEQINAKSLNFLNREFISSFKITNQLAN